MPTLRTTHPKNIGALRKFRIADRSEQPAFFFASWCLGVEALGLTRLPNIQYLTQGRDGAGAPWGSGPAGLDLRRGT